MITGGAGFLGTLLARRLLDSAVGTRTAPNPDPSTSWSSLDLVAPPPDLASDPRVRAVVGELETTLADLGEADAVFHLAGVVSSAAETDFDLGMRTNLDGTRALLGTRPGATRAAGPGVLQLACRCSAAIPPIGPIGRRRRRHASSAPVQLRHTEVHRRATRRRLHPQGVRPRPLRAVDDRRRCAPASPTRRRRASCPASFASRLRAKRAVCPVPPDTPIALSSPAAHHRRARWPRRLRRRDVGQHDGDEPARPDHHTGGDGRPRSTASPAPGTSDLVEWTDDPAVAAIISSWPARFHTPRAERLGLHAEQSFDDIVTSYVADNEGFSA